MKDKRNIDELFKSQLSDYQAAPSPEVWERIEAQLKKKKDRKVIPLWWKLGGVAALLALLLMVGNSLFVSDTSSDIVIEDELIVDPADNDAIQEEPILTKKDAYADEERGLKTSDKKETQSDIINPKSGNNNSKRSQQEIVQNQEAKTPISPQKILQTPSVSKNERVAKTNEEFPKNMEEKEPNGNLKANEIERIDETRMAKIKEEENKIKESSNPTKENPKEISNDNREIETGIAAEETEKQQEDSEASEIKKKSIFDAIEENKKEAIAETQKKNSGGWEVTPNVGPVYYNSLNGGSSIDPSFADNSQTGEVNFSYGVQVAYELNERFSIRSGVNNVNVGYATGDIEVASGPAAFGLKAVSYENSGRNVLTVFDKGTIPNVPVDPNDPYAQLNLKSTSGNAELRQSITYFEVPLEAKYKLVNARFGVNMIGGFSTLFLNDSEVSVNDNGFRSVLGEANNLNSVSFSTNIGLGIDYKLSKRFKLNLEPIFKYQINPYSDSSVAFNPYYFGIYSGLSFKF